MAQSTLSKPKPKSAARWLFQQLKQAGLSDSFRVKTQQRGNTLHLLLEGDPCPDMLVALDALALALESSALPVTALPVYRILVYGRGRGERRPRWKKPIELTQLDRIQSWVHQQRRQVTDAGLVNAGLTHADLTKTGLTKADLTKVGLTEAQLVAARRAGGATEATVGLPSEATALMISNRNRAQAGDPEAIARFLSESLSALGISVRVAAKPLSEAPSETLGSQQRLWVLCESNYSLDAAVTADPVVALLRSLDLTGFQDAAIFSQVRGESRPDWALRVDLTPKQELLRQWARWGDVESIVRLLNPVLAELGCRVTAQPQNKSLQLFCEPIWDLIAGQPIAGQPIAGQPIAEQPRPLDAALIKTAIALVLEELAPQGLHAATVYGLSHPASQGQQTPQAHQWVEWLTLPAATHTNLATPTLELAESGDLAAATFLLSRVLNPDLDQQLQTGGIRVQLLRKGDLLHAMCDAPICPRRQTIGRPAVKYLRQLRLPKVSGVRIYGRRAGQVQPRWQYGRDFVPRQQDAVDLVPQFDVASTQDEDLLKSEAEAINLEQAPWGIALPSVKPAGEALRHALEQVQQVLLKTQLFSTAVPASHNPGRTVATLWAVLGLVAAGSTDLVLGNSLRQGGRPSETPASTLDLASAPNVLGDVLLGDRAEGAFRSGSFTVPQTNSRQAHSGQAHSGQANSGQANSEQMVQVSALQEGYPDFNNALFNEKLALYRQRVISEGVPDVLILGSSRALRGIAPSVLATELAAVGYPDLSIFNFSINGSTAQVVELQLSLLLDSKYRPGLIIWADGARAFNSGRQDSTFQAIQASPAYQRLNQGSLPPLFSDDDPLGKMRLSQSDSGFSQVTRRFNVQGLDTWLDERVGRWSSTHGQRDRIQAYLKQRFAQGVTDLQRNTGLAQTGFDHGELVPDAPEGEGVIDFDGFMPLSSRFNPATYYQRYSRVNGAYDGDYQRFRLSGVQQQSLDNVVRLTQEKQIPLVFVNLPLTGDYLDPVRSRYERLFQKDMFQRMTERQLMFRELSTLWPAEVENFSDPSHLNLYGARQVSMHLSEDPLIPWPQAIRN